MPRKDFYYNKAKVEGYRSRASYKLKQINEFHSVIKRNDSVVDIGAAPGGWLQVAIELSKTGIVIGVDMQKIEPLEGAITIRGDITKGTTKEKIKSILEDKEKRKGKKKLRNGGSIDIVLSDLAPNITGEYSLDQARSIYLGREALECALEILCHGGNFVVKVFYGTDIDEFLQDLNQEFETVKVFNPRASRKESAEVYIICKGRLTAPIKVGEKVVVEIVGEGKRGDGVANIQGYTVFVPGSKIGESWNIKIDEVRLEFGFASCVSEVKKKIN
jgi:23S rRNA (uridine2552-2'-O)-methyltransferase